MSEDQPKTRTPRLDSVVKAIEAGSYDDDIKIVYDAVMGRKAMLQQKALAFVKEVFGDDYGVSLARPNPAPAGARPNVFIERARKHGEAEVVEAPQGDPMSPEEEAALRASAATEEQLGPDHESRSPLFGAPTQ